LCFGFLSSFGPKLSFASDFRARFRFLRMDACELCSRVCSSQRSSRLLRERNAECEFHTSSSDDGLERQGTVLWQWAYFLLSLVTTIRLFAFLNQFCWKCGQITTLNRVSCVKAPRNDGCSPQVACIRNLKAGFRACDCQPEARSSRSYMRLGVVRPVSIRAGV
jgi:hypothetical protein